MDVENGILKTTDSILNSVKKMLGITEEYYHFDADIIMHINSAFLALSQLGIGPSIGFTILDSQSTWLDFIGDDSRFEAVKSYVFLKVKLLFDPPASASVLEAMKSMIAELEWRLNIVAETSGL